MSYVRRMTIQTGVRPEWTLADKLRKAREHAGLEQSELADRAGISRQAISNYEQGKRTPRRPVLWAWADVCGVDREWLMGAVDDMNKLPHLDSNQEPSD